MSAESNDSQKSDEGSQQQPVRESKKQQGDPAKPDRSIKPPKYGLSLNSEYKHTKEQKEQRSDE
jgi:hypothetical protein